MSFVILLWQNSEVFLPEMWKWVYQAQMQHLGGFGQQQEGNAAQVGGNARTNNGSNNNERDAKEKPKPFIKGMLPAGFGSGEFIKKRKDDDTLREVGNVMPEYDCDKDDVQKNSIEKTQDSNDTAAFKN